MEKTPMSLTKGPIWKSLVFFAMPILLGNLFQQMYNTVDVLIVGKYLGSASLAAVSATGSLIFLLTGFLNGVANGAGVVIARYYGAEDNEGLKKSINTTIAAGIIAGVVFTIVGVFATPTLLRLMNTPEEVMGEAILYFRIIAAGIFNVVMYNTFVAVLQAVGDSKHPLYYLISTSILNLILDIMFVTAFDMGVEGAALATIISQFVSAILCLQLLLTGKSVYKLHINQLKIDNKILVQVLKVGIPTGFQAAVISFANVLAQAQVNTFGPAAIAGCGVYDKIEGFGIIPSQTFSVALTTFVSQNIGARQLERADEGAKLGLKVIVIVAECVGIILAVFAPVFIAFFDDDPAVIQYGVDRARVTSVFIFFLAITHTKAAVLRGKGNAFVPMVVMFVCWCAIRISIVMAATIFLHDIFYVNIAYPFTWALSAFVLIIYERRFNRTHNSIEKLL